MFGWEPSGLSLAQRHPEPLGQGFHVRLFDDAVVRAWDDEGRQTSRGNRAPAQVRPVPEEKGLRAGPKKGDWAGIRSWHVTPARPQIRPDRFDVAVRQSAAIVESLQLWPPGFPERRP